MVRAVAPWTWRRALRDHGPKNPSVLLTLYTIGTFMNRSGFAFPSQKLIATGIRASVKTVQRHLDQAALEGWIAVEIAGRGGKGWRHYGYRAAVPDGLPLDYLDEEITDAVESMEGGIEGGDIAMSPRAKFSPAFPSGEPDAGDIRGVKVATSGYEGGDTGVRKVATQLCRTNSRSETLALRTHAKREAQSEDCAVSLSLNGKESHKPDPDPMNKPHPELQATAKEVLQGKTRDGRGTAPWTPQDESRLLHAVKRLIELGSLDDSEIHRQLEFYGPDDRISRAIALFRDERRRSA